MAGMINSHVGIQKRLEINAIANVLPYIEKRLNIKIQNDINAYCYERPDFIFRNEHETVGVEVVECHPSVQNNKRNNAVKRIGFQRKVCQIVKNGDILKKVTKNQKLNVVVYRYDIGEYAGANSCEKLTPELFAEQVVKILKIWNSEHVLCTTFNVKQIKLFETIGKNIVQFNNISRRDPVNWKHVENCIKIKTNIVLNNFCARCKMQNGNTLQKSQQFNPPMRKQSHLEVV